MLNNRGLQHTALAEAPWYRQFWPWFIIALPATVVVAGFFMLYLAIRYSDELVSDNYYRDGLAINQLLSQDIRASELALSAELNFAAGVDVAYGVLSVQLSSARSDVVLPEILSLQLLHPTDAKSDRMLTLVAAGSSRYRGQFPNLPAHRFYLRLMPGLVADRDSQNQAAWRLSGELDFALAQAVTLNAAALKPPGLNMLKAGPSESNISAPASPTAGLLKP